MTMCWSQHPKARPSASQIVSIAAAPEFVHLIDVTSLDDNMPVLCGTIIKTPHEISTYIEMCYQQFFILSQRENDFLKNRRCLSS